MTVSCQVSRDTTYDNNFAHARAHEMIVIGTKKYLSAGNQLDCRQTKRLQQMLLCGLEATTGTSSEDIRLHQLFQEMYDEHFAGELVGAA